MLVKIDGVKLDRRVGEVARLELGIHRVAVRAAERAQRNVVVAVVLGAVAPLVALRRPADGIVGEVGARRVGERVLGAVVARRALRAVGDALVVVRDVIVLEEHRGAPRRRRIVAADEQRHERAAVDGARRREPRQLDKRGVQVDLSGGLAPRAARRDPRPARQQVHPRIKLVGVALVHEHVELAEGEAVVRGEEEECAVERAELVDRANDGGDEVVHAHQRPPAVLEDAGGHRRRLSVEHRVGCNVAVVVGARRKRAVVARRPRLVIRPRRVPMVEIPRRGNEGLMRRLRCDVCKPRPALGRHLPYPRNREVAHHRRRVVLLRALPVPILDPRPLEAVRPKLGRDVIAAAVGKPRVEAERHDVRPVVEVLAEHPDREPRLLAQLPRKRVVVDLAHLRVRRRAVEPAAAQRGRAAVARALRGWDSRVIRSWRLGLAA